MAVELKVPGMELASEVLQRLLREIQDAGRFCSSQGMDLPTVERYNDRSEALFQALHLAEELASGPIVVTNCPVIYNPTRWHTSVCADMLVVTFNFQRWSYAQAT